MVEMTNGSAEAENGKPMPNAISVEREVLGAMLLNQDAITQAAAIVSKDSFYHTGHQIVFESIMSLNCNNKAADSVAVIETLRAKGCLENAGGERYVMRLVGQIATTANIEDHAQIIQDHAIRRDVIKMGHNLSARAFDTEVSAADLVSTGQSELSRLATNIGDIGLRTVYEVWEGQVEQIDAGGGVGAVTTGLEALDDVMPFGGLTPGEQFVLGAQKRTGKTAMAVQMAIATARKNIPVAFTAFESNPYRLHDRFKVVLSQQDLYLEPMSSVEVGDLIRSRYNGSHQAMDRYIAAGSAIASLPITFLMNPPTLDTVLTRLKMLHNMGQCEMSIVDHIQLVKGGNVSDRRLDVDRIVNELADFAVTNNIIQVLLSQLGRTSAREDRRPILEDLQETGAIEQRADTVCLLWRPGVAGEWSEEYGARTKRITRGRAKIIVNESYTEANFEKQRNGVSARAMLSFDADRCRFVSAKVDENAEAAE